MVAVTARKGVEGENIADNIQDIDLKFVVQS